MKNFKKVLSVLLVLSFLIALPSCIFRTKDPLPPEDKTLKTLTVYNMYDSNDVFDSLIQKYVANHPYTNIVYKKFTNFKDYETEILNGLAEGEGPDIFAMPNNWFIKNRKKLVPMPDALGTVDAFRSIFVDVAANDLITTDSGGVEHAYGVPMYVDNLALYYNKDQYEDRVPTRGKPATTWDGIKNDVYALTKTGPAPSYFDVAGIAMGKSKNIVNAVDILYALMIQFGTAFYDSTMSNCILASSGSTATGEVPSASALDFYTSFSNSSQKHYSWNEYMAADYGSSDIAAFAAGKVSMIFGYSTTYPQILAQINSLKEKGVSVIDVSAIKTAPFPQLNDPAVSTNKRDTYASYFAFGVSRTTKFSDAAWDFLTFITSPENERYYFEKTNKPTSRRDLIAEEKLDPLYGTFVNQVGYAESFPIVDIEKYNEMFSSAIDAVNNGKSSRNTLTTIQDTITLMLPKNGYITPLNPEANKAKTPAQ